MHSMARSTRYLVVSDVIAVPDDFHDPKHPDLRHASTDAPGTCHSTSFRGLTRNLLLLVCTY